MNFSDFEYISSIDNSLNNSYNTSPVESTDEEYEYHILTRSGSCPNLKRLGKDLNIERTNSCPSIEEKNIISEETNIWSDEQEKLLTDWVEEEEDVWSTEDVVQDQPFNNIEWSEAWANWDKRKEPEWPASTTDDTNDTIFDTIKKKFYQGVIFIVDSFNQLCNWVGSFFLK